jgi:DNA-binding transcriptional LysR family regulator
VTQPAISQQIRQLEKRLNVRLVERIGRKARATPAGRDLLAHVGPIGAAVEAAVDAVAAHAGAAAGRVSIGTGATACIFLLPPVLRDLRDRFPEIDIVVSVTNTVDVVRAVLDNELDVGLVTLPASGRMIEVTPLLEDEFAAVSAADRPLAEIATPDVLSAQPLLLYEPGGATRRLVDGWLAGAQRNVRPMLSLGSVEAIKELVAAGLGCSVLPSLALRREEDRRGLAIRPLSPPLTRTLGLVVRRDKRLSRALRATVNALEALRTAS